MSGVPHRGERLVIRWPGGPHDFEMVFLHLDDTMPGPHEPGWLWLYGKVGESRLGDLTVSDYSTLYARPVSPGLYEMVPHQGHLGGPAGGTS